MSVPDSWQDQHTGNHTISYMHRYRVYTEYTIYIERERDTIDPRSLVFVARVIHSPR